MPLNRKFKPLKEKLWNKNKYTIILPLLYVINASFQDIFFVRNDFL